MKRLFVTCIVLFAMIFSWSEQGYSQKADTVNLISVSLHIVAEGMTPYFKNVSPGYFVMVTIANLQDTSIHFWIMNCSWPNVNWVTNNDSVYFGYPECDNNFPIKIELLPHRALDFYGIFSGSEKKLEGKKVRMGFVYFTNFHDIFEASARRSKIRDYKKYWSNEVKVEDNLFKYQTY